MSAGRLRRKRVASKGIDGRLVDYNRLKPYNDLVSFKSGVMS